MKISQLWVDFLSLGRFLLGVMVVRVRWRGGLYHENPTAGDDLLSRGSRSRSLLPRRYCLHFHRTRKRRVTPPAEQHVVIPILGPEP